jgi:hypothetical protein
MKRFRAVAGVRLSDGAEAAKIGLQFADGTSDEIEVERDSMRDLLRPLLAVCKAFGDRTPRRRQLPNVTPDETVVIDAQELAVQSEPGGGRWLILRAGSLDVSVFFPDASAAQVLAKALLNPSAPSSRH